ncbi:hypothetical protein Vadar_005215 [Vaccinium darrowii]|uniref:Uncharacterized protein n=1 Tax=Vaccinium darrowii TaxID=229202 RepID=A0ACB7YKE9_9ERIC|nr:hypothetical protein Vadar_005215 [Vaccinium darrowii]
MTDDSDLVHKQWQREERGQSSTTTTGVPQPLSTANPSPSIPPPPSITTTTKSQTLLPFRLCLSLFRAAVSLSSQITDLPSPLKSQILRHRSHHHHDVSAGPNNLPKLVNAEKKFQIGFLLPLVYDEEEEHHEVNAEMIEFQFDSFVHMSCDIPFVRIPIDFVVEFACTCCVSMVKNGLFRESCDVCNSGGEALVDTTTFMADTFFQGGDAFQNDEHIVESGDHAFIYQSARLGNFCYRVDNIPPGDYYVDLHIVEIINTYGPKGMRVFNLFMQEEKASQLVEFDYLHYRVNVAHFKLKVKEFQRDAGAFTFKTTAARSLYASIPVPVSRAGHNVASIAGVRVIRRRLRTKREEEDAEEEDGEIHSL